MVLAAGFSPLPSNDVWVTKDGISWYFDGHAPWPKRAYHGAASLPKQAMDPWRVSVVERCLGGECTN